MPKVYTTHPIFNFGVAMVLTLGLFGVSVLSFEFISNHRSSNSTSIYALEIVKSIEIYTSASIEIIHSRNNYIELANSSIVYSLDNGKLKLTDSGLGLVQVFTAPDKNVRIYVSSLESITLFANTELRVSLPKTQQPKLEVIGSGSIYASDIDSQDLNTKIVGSGKIILNGKTERIISNILGSGTTDTSNLEIKYSD